MPPRFLDTNILLRYFTRDDQAKAERALALLQRVERGEEKVETSLIVVFEAVYALQRLYQVPHTQIRTLLLPVIRLRGLHLPGKQLCMAALERYATTNVSFADAYHSVYLQARGQSEIYSWDTDFDKLPGIRRPEPPASPSPPPTAV
jgi:predicted nucleic acid-binding protein